MAANTQWIGKPVNRVDGRAKVTGTATYAAEAKLPRMTHAVLIGAAVAAGRIERLDTTRAEAAPGVLLVLTHRNRGPMGTPPNDQEKSKRDEARLPLQDVRVTRRDQPVAMVVAETLEQAAFAGSLIDVSYREQPFVVDPEEASPSAYLAGKSQGADQNTSRGHVQQALSEAEFYFEGIYNTPMEHPAPMEPHGVIASWDGKLLTVFSSTQWVMGEQAALQAALYLEREQVHVIAPYVGGMFGSKAVTSGHTLLAGLASKKLGRPVKTILSRRQVFTNIGHRTHTTQKFELAATRDGKLTAMRHVIRTHNSIDAKKDDFIEPVSMSSRSLYECANYQSQHFLVRLNVIRPSWMRAPGEMPCQYALESALDELAYKMKMDPVELRRRNEPDKDPHRGTPFSSRHLLECYQRGTELFKWNERNREPRSTREGDWFIGHGMATASYPGNVYGATVKVSLHVNGGRLQATVSTAGIDVGTGMYTMMALTAAEGLGLPIESVEARLGDTNLPQCVYAGGSNLTASTAPPIMEACTAIKLQLLEMAESLGGAFEGARIHPDRYYLGQQSLVPALQPSAAVSIPELLQKRGGQPVEATAKSEQNPGHDDHFTYHSTGAHFIEVRVHAYTGEVRVSRVVSVFDVGRVLNAKAGRSQLLGGVVFGIGAALHEQLKYDDYGQATNANFSEYFVPLAADIPNIDIQWLDIPDYRFNALGCRGIGEIGITGSPAAVANAVFNATGVRVRQLPITPQKVVAGLRENEV